MNGNQMLDLIGDVESSYLMEAQAHREGTAPKRSRWSGLKIALIAAAMLFLAGCAAAVVFGLQDLKIGEYAYDEPNQDNWDVISLQGFAGSPGYQAAIEWQKFWETAYDDELRLYTNYHNYEFPEEFEAYGCQSQEMMDKVDEICTKYSLKPHGKLWHVLNIQDIFDAIGIRDIRSEGTLAQFHLDVGSCYADGSFYIEGGVKFPGQRVGSRLTVTCARKGSFHTSGAAISNIENFDQWYYTMEDGAEVLLANYREEVLMIADRAEYFIVVRLDGEGTVLLPDQQDKRRAVEAMADCFVFSIQPQPADAAILDAAQQDWDDMWAEDQARHEREFRRRGYKAYLIQNPPAAEDREFTKYALADLNGDGVEELILSFHGSVQHVLTTDGEYTSLMADTCRMREVVLCENNVFRSKKQHGDCFAYTFYRLDGGALKPFDFLDYHAEMPGQWGRSCDGDFICEQQIAEAEARAIIDSYAPLSFDWKLTCEFPMNETK